MNNKKTPLVFSGRGAISHAGLDCRDSLVHFYEKMRTHFPAPASPAVGTSLTDPVFELTDFFPGEPGRSVRLAETAVREALESACLSEPLRKKYRVGVCVGTTIAAQLNNLPLYASIRKQEAVDPEELRAFVNTSPAEAVARIFSLTGPVLTVSNACASGTDAIGIAAAWIRAGYCDMALAVGTDEINRVPIAGFHALGVASPDPCRPFDRDRKGLNLGEGAGALLIEPEELALSRGIRPAFRLAGYGNACDAYHITSPHPEGEGLASAVGAALAEAGITPADVAFINAHGTATKANDNCEGNLFARMFGPHVRYLSTKGWTGHTLGAAGALEAVFTLLMLERGELPPGRGFENPDPGIACPPVSEFTVLDNPRFALSNSLAFGGSNAAVVIERMN